MGGTARELNRQKRLLERNNLLSSMQDEGGK
jgi:hypothetical protein